MPAQFYFYSLAKQEIVDDSFDGEHGRNTWQSFEDLKATIPDLVCGSLAEATEALESSFVLPPVEITLDEFNDRLSIMSPLGHVRSDYSESFKLEDFYHGNITEICCRIDKRYFSLRDRATLPHKEIVKRVCNAFAASEFEKLQAWRIESSALIIQAELAALTASVMSQLHGSESASCWWYASEEIRLDHELEMMELPSAFYNPLRQDLSADCELIAA